MIKLGRALFLSTTYFCPRYVVITHVAKTKYKCSFFCIFGSSKKCRIVICCLINYFLFSDKPPVGPPLCHNRGTQDRVWPEKISIKILISLEIKKYLKTIFAKKSISSKTVILVV